MAFEFIIAARIPSLEIDLNVSTIFKEYIKIAYYEDQL